METRWNNINFDITSDSLTNNMPFDQPYNVHWELVECLELVYEILDDLEDIRIALEKGKDPSTILRPTFDPLKTIRR